MKKLVLACAIIAACLGAPAAHAGNPPCQAPVTVGPCDHKNSDGSTETCAYLYVEISSPVGGGSTCISD